MNDLFTVEEVNLICIFDTSSRNALIESLTVAIQDFDEPELTEIAEGVRSRLSIMSDADFAALELYPEYEDYAEEQEV